jgi:hypothetical protein
VRRNTIAILIIVWRCIKYHENGKLRVEAVTKKEGGTPYYIRLPSTWQHVRVKTGFFRKKDFGKVEKILDNKDEEDSVISHRSD